MDSQRDENTRVRFHISFSIRAKTQSIKSEFVVDTETYQSTIFERQSESEIASLSIWRTEKGYECSANQLDQRKFREYFGFRGIDGLKEVLSAYVKPNPQQLLFSPSTGGFFGFFGKLKRPLKDLEGLRVFQVNARTARQPGTPSIIGGLGRHGENLPVVVDSFLERQKVSGRLIDWMRDVIPALGSLQTNYTETKQIGLFLQEEGFGGPWYAEDLSDGTIMSLALFICLLEQTHRFVFIEEPENSLHPWILKRFLDRCREISPERQIVLTTHSPMVVAAAMPEELFLIERNDGITEIVPAMEREPLLSSVIRKSALDLGEYWMSGGLGAIPRPKEDFDT